MGSDRHFAQQQSTGPNAALGQKRTWFSPIVMSALCHKRTYAVQQFAAYSIT
jgi:hypothetical protein